MLKHLTTKKVNEIIGLVAADSVATRARRTSDDDVGWGERHDDYQAAREAINELPAPARRELVALMQFGSNGGMRSTRHLANLASKADAENAAGYLVGKGDLLGRYLRDGLLKLH